MGCSFVINTAIYEKDHSASSTCEALSFHWVVWWEHCHACLKKQRLPPLSSKSFTMGLKCLRGGIDVSSTLLSFHCIPPFTLHFYTCVHSKMYSACANWTGMMDVWTAELRRAHSWLLADDTYRNSVMKPQRLLGHLEGDAVVEMLKFAPGDTCLTLAAVSPKARLLAELLESKLARTLHLLLDDSTVMHELVSEAAGASFLQRLDTVAWWIEKCGIPLSIRGDETALTLVTLSRLRPILRSVSLSLLVRACPIPTDVVLRLERMDMGGEAFASLSENLSQMVHLRELHVSRCTSTALLRLYQLPSLTTLSIESKVDAEPLGNANATGNPQQNLNGVDEIDMHLLASAHSLQHLGLRSSGLSVVSGFDSCESLSTVTVVNCERLLSLSSLAHAVNLRSISISWSGVRDLGALAACPSLERVAIDTCTAVESLTALAGAPRLREVDVFCSGVRDINGLASCPCLETLCIVACRVLTDLSPLAGAPRLRIIDASFSAVRNLEGLGTCPSLEVVRLDACIAVHNLNPLADAPRLKYVLVKGLDHAALVYPPSLTPKILPAAAS
ncbi:hypothetical protein, unknown function [Leishmania tarentolae]|uniref:Leucine-rich repeat protein n=1 Tax=Leishmania tarentolae TaxID=5689 RepID=A0A640KCW2_LEITA|nr:hypothetical protein, unknown function [Leishmania tarentolae]